MQVNNFKNHGKKWSSNDYKVLNNYIKTHEIIFLENVEELAAILERNYYSIEYKILDYISEEFDLIDIDKNKILYKKFNFLNKKNIDDYVISKKFITKKEKLYYYLINISFIIEKSEINNKEEVNELINNINHLIDNKKK
jgi:hypothetical protein